MSPPKDKVRSAEDKKLEEEEFLRHVARLYYVDKLSQAAIAKQKFASRQTIGKALQRAEQRGIVRISVVPELRTGYLQNLQRDLRSRLGLDDLQLVAGHNLDSLPEGELADDTVASLAQAAAEYLGGLLTNKDILAVSGGRAMMRQVVRYLKPTRLLEQLHVVPTIGFIKSHTAFGDANLISYDIATAYGARHWWLPIPAIVETSEQCDCARSLPLAREVLQKINQATIVVTGLWAEDLDRLKRESILSEDQVESMRKYRPVADINHWTFNADGECINEKIVPRFYLTGLEIPALKQRVQSGEVKVILVSGGSRSLVPAISAVLKAGIVSILITDHVTAESLLTSR